MINCCTKKLCIALYTDSGIYDFRLWIFQTAANYIHRFTLTVSFGNVS